MKPLIPFLKRSLDWLESEAVTSFLANPAKLPRYQEHAGAHAVVLAIDVSPSMEESDYPPTRLEGAKRAVRRYLDTLARQEPEALTGIVDFHGEAEVVSPPLPVGEQHRELVAALRRLHSGCGTNIGGALRCAKRGLGSVPSPVSPTVILLTDGESNQGPDPVKEAQALKSSGIQLDIIGIGGSPAEVNEPDLKRMASVVHGQLRYWFIESADALVERFEALALREIR